MFYNEDFYSNCSGVKLRKRKKKEKNEDDILSIYQKVIYRFEEDKETNKSVKQEILEQLSKTKIPYGVNKQQIENILKKNNITLSSQKIISYKEYKDLLEKYTELENDDTVEKHNMFLNEVKPVIEQYNEIIKKPVKINFFTSSKDDEDKSELNDLKQQFIKIVNKTYPDMVKTINIKEQPSSKTSSISNSCENCGFEQSFESSNMIVCENCGMESQHFFHSSEFQDVERVNFSKKYTYKKYIHFRDTLKNFQGKQNRVVDEVLIQRLEKEMIKDGIIDSAVTNHYMKYERVRKEHIRIYLDQIGENKHYENTNLIYTEMTKLQNHTITKELEDTLMNDFQLFTEAFLEVSSENNSIQRTNILSSSYILYQLLRKHNYRCREEDFSLPTSQKCRYEQEYIYSLCCEKLGWNLVSIL